MKTLNLSKEDWRRHFFQKYKIGQKQEYELMWNAAYDLGYVTGLKNAAEYIERRLTGRIGEVL